MSLDSLLRILSRRRYVLVAALLILAGLAVPVLRAQPVYHSQADLVLVAPGAGELTDGEHSQGLIAFAALVEREINDGAPVARLSSSTASLFGAGVRQGWSVVVPNLGGQWENSFTRPVLSVEVVDSTPERVESGMQRVLARVEAVTDELQARQGVVPSDRIDAVRVPAEPTVAYVGATRGGMARAALVVTVLCVAGAVVATVLVDRLLTRRPTRRTQPVVG